jgi:hypothetical protein
MPRIARKRLNVSHISYDYDSKQIASRFKLHINLTVPSFRTSYNQVHAIIHGFANQYPSSIISFKSLYIDWEEQFRSLAHFYLALASNDKETADRIRKTIKYLPREVADKVFEQQVSHAPLGRKYMLQHFKTVIQDYRKHLRSGHKQYTIYFYSFRSRDAIAINNICQFALALDKKLKMLNLEPGLIQDSDSMLSPLISFRQDSEVDNGEYYSAKEFSFKATQEKSALYQMLCREFHKAKKGSVTTKIENKVAQIESKIAKVEITVKGMLSKFSIMSSTKTAPRSPINPEVFIKNNEISGLNYKEIKRE